jgi:hypothetical protein
MMQVRRGEQEVRESMQGMRMSKGSGGVTRSTSCSRRGSRSSKRGTGIRDWGMLAAHVKTRTATQCRTHFQKWEKKANQANQGGCFSAAAALKRVMRRPSWEGLAKKPRRAAAVSTAAVATMAAASTTAAITTDGMREAL